MSGNDVNQKMEGNRQLHGFHLCIHATPETWKRQNMSWKKQLTFFLGRQKKEGQSHRTTPSWIFEGENIWPLQLLNERWPRWRSCCGKDHKCNWPTLFRWLYTTLEWFIESLACQLWHHPNPQVSRWLLFMDWCFWSWKAALFHELQSQWWASQVELWSIALSTICSGISRCRDKLFQIWIICFRISRRPSKLFQNGIICFRISRWSSSVCSCWSWKAALFHELQSQWWTSKVEMWSIVLLTICFGISRFRDKLFQIWIICFRISRRPSKLFQNGIICFRISRWTFLIQRNWYMSHT